MRLRKLLLMTLTDAALVTTQSHAHDAWLAVKWDANKNSVLISALIAERFPDGKLIKAWSRFVEGSAYSKS